MPSLTYKKGDSRNMTPTILIDHSISIIIIIVLLCSISSTNRISNRYKY